MKSEVKTETCNVFCKGCEDWTDCLEDEHGVYLCADCNLAYDNKTGYCSLHCCVTGRCDQTC